MANGIGQSAELPDESTSGGEAVPLEKGPCVRTGSHLLLEGLIRSGCETVFGYPGGAIMPMYDALYDFSDRLRHILVRHEQGAAHAAEGYARMTGRAGVCFATSGPGATNLVTGIADAMLDSIPLVCITGQVASHLLGTDAFQETDIIGITMPITKWNYQITRIEEISHIIDKAFRVAESGRPGPVLIDITKDVQSSPLEQFDEALHRSLQPDPVNNFHALPKVSEEEGARVRASLQRAADLINRSERPLLLAGHGIQISGAEEALLAFAEQCQVPVACTLHGLSVFPVDHPLSVGMLGMHGNYAPNLLTNEADLIIAVGMRFDDRVTGNLKKYVPSAAVIHIDRDPAELGKNVRPTVGIVGDAKEILERLSPMISREQPLEWLERFSLCLAVEQETIFQPELFPTEGPLKMGEVIRVLSEVTKGEAVVVADVGQHQMMAARYYRFQHPRSFFTSGGLGTMGFAVPAALGAQVGAPDRKVLAIVGDGGFQMTLQELGTIAQERLPVKIVILNNNYLGMVRQWQELFFDSRYSSVHLENPDFQMITRGFGIPALLVEEREALEESVRRMWAHQGPCLLEVRVEKEQNVFPMVPTGASVSEIRLK